MNLNLEKKITSLRVVTLFVLSYVVGFAFKIAYFFSDVLVNIITDHYSKAFTSILSGILLAGGLFIASTNKKEINFKYVKSVFFLFDIITMLFILNVFNQNGIELYKVIFISVLFPTVGMVSIIVFVERFSKQEAKEERNRNELKQNKAELKRLEAFRCVNCHRQFNSQNGLNAHKCKLKIKNIDVDFQEIKSKLNK